MASVRISQEVLDHIKREAREKFLLSDPKPTNKPELSDLLLLGLRETSVYKKAWAFAMDPEVQAIVRSSQSNNSVGGKLQHFSNTKIVHKISVSGLNNDAGMPIQFENELRTPATMLFASEYGPTLSFHIDMIDQPYKTEIVNAVKTGLRDITAWEERLKEYTTRTNEIFDACKSTKQLLDAWPAAEVFLPKAVVDKMQAKTTSTADLEAKAKREAFAASGTANQLNQHILVAGIIADVVQNNGDKS